MKLRTNIGRGKNTRVILKKKKKNDLTLISWFFFYLEKGPSIITNINVPVRDVTLSTSILDPRRVLITPFNELGTLEV